MKEVLRFSPGLSTVEVIFSIFLIAVTLVVYAASLNLVPLAKTAKYQNTAYHLALKHLEILRNTDYSSLPATGPLSDTDFSLLPSGAGTLTVTDAATNLKHATVTITWSESGTTRSVTLDTYIYQSGLNSL